jgi:NADPH-dependent 2,4-dienoyl-CoA reductase/sulfur reductase-like enzyme/rhodanese-related sulfurtransferase
MDNIKVLTNRRVLKIDPNKKSIIYKELDGEKDKTLSYDKLVLATGAKPIVPPIPGIDLKNIFVLRSINDAFIIKEAIHNEGVDSTCIIGGGLIGLEMAENLSSRGIRVTVVEKLPQILNNLDPEMANIVEKHLKEIGIEVFTGEGVISFSGTNGKVSKVLTEKRTISTDMVILSIGIRPNVELAKEAGIGIGTTGAISVNERMETDIDDIYAVGDCTETIHIVTQKPVWIPLGTTANKQARVAAINIAGGDDRFPGVVGSMIVKVGKLNIAKTGIIEREAKEYGYNYEIVLVPANDKAHYYPGRREIMVKLIAERESGKLLGGEIVGEGASDKRIDILATAITGELTCDQLSKLDLAYAPPYSPVLDPIIVAANVMRNKLERRTIGISPELVANKLKNGEDFTLIDCRTKSEFDGGFIENAKLIPLSQIKDRKGEIEKDKETVVYCLAGLRSAKGMRILRNSGFNNVKYMDGGLKGWRFGIKKPE